MIASPRRIAGPAFVFRTLVALLAPVALLSLGALTGCGERRDTAGVGANIAPFSELRGINIAALRSGGVRAFRAAAEPAPFEGLRESIGDYDVLFAVPGFIGTDGSWPAEDALVSGIEATRDWPSDSGASAAWHDAIRAIRAATGATPSCLEVAGPGFRMSVVEFPRGGTWTLATTFAPETTITSPATRSTLATSTTLSARQSLSINRVSLGARFPAAGDPNPEDRPTWTSVDCPTL